MRALLVVIILVVVAYGAGPLRKQHARKSAPPRSFPRGHNAGAVGFTLPVRRNLKRMATPHVRVMFKDKGKPRTYPIGGNLDVMNEWFIVIGLGTPPQHVELQIDTGSTDLVVYAAGCSGCPANQTRTFYDIGKSKTGSYVDCESSSVDCQVVNIPDDCWDGSYCPFTDDYGGGSGITGPVTTDALAFPNNTFSISGYGVDFGSILQSTGTPLEVSGVDGILGFAYSAISAWQGPSAFSDIVGQYDLYESFSLCLNANPALELGTDYWTNTTARAQYQWTAIDSSPGWFSITLQDAGMGGKSLGVSPFKLNQMDVIVDSGTTLVIVNDDIIAAYTKTLQAMCASGVNLVGFCGVPAASNILAGQIAAYPSVSFSPRAANSTLFHHYQFDLVIPSQLYILPICNQTGYYGFGIQSMGDAAGLPIILGDVLMQNWHVVFDKDSGYIGFGSQRSCPTPTN